MSWLKTALIWVCLALAVLAAHHHFIKVPAQKRADARARVAALESKVSANFDNYLKAAPLLKGDVADAFAKELDSRIEELGYSPERADLKWMTPIEKWKTVLAEKGVMMAWQEAELARREAMRVEREEVGAAYVDENMVSCRNSFSDECSEMIEFWLCIRGEHCTEHATDSLQEYVQEVMERTDRDYKSPNDGLYCVDASVQCYD